MKLKIALSLLVMLAGQWSFAADLDEIQEKGIIEFAMYDNFPPFSYKDEDGRIKGISVEIGKAIAKKMAIKADLRLFQIDESVEDDLRNVIWKGHFTAGPPADVMLHVPYDTNFAAANDKVIFTQPYFRQAVAFAINPSQIGSPESLKVFTREKIGVERGTAYNIYLILGAFNGLLRENVRHYTSTAEAVAAMVNQEVAAVMGNRGELEYGLSKHQHDFIVKKLPTPGLPVEGWELGAAISAKRPALASKINEVLGSMKENGEIEAIFSSFGLSYQPAESSALLANTEEE